MNTIQLRYFASIREAIGTGAERLSTAAPTLAALRDELIARGGAHAEALARGRAVRVSLNQAMADESAGAVNSPMAATPATPASRTTGRRSPVTPPMASTGIVACRLSARNPSGPRHGWPPGFEGVGHTVPAMT